MNPFIFELAKGISLQQEKGKFYLFSETPIRYLRLNKNFYDIVKTVTAGSSLQQITENKSVKEKKQIVNALFTLVSKGYLNLKLSSRFEIKKDQAPSVSVIIPVRNRPEDMADCLKSLLNLDYPAEKLEIIVVDDGSTDDTVRVIESFGVKIICNKESRGPAECRNLGEKTALGEILAFLDSDCTVHPDWLKEIIPFFSLSGIGAVGGFVASFFRTSLIDRYEEAFSSLNMGRRIIFEKDAKSNFYVPSCNLFVRREAFQEIGGFKPGMHLGEDVDLCWRLRGAGYSLLYVPFGAVNHKHRNMLRKMLKRRFEYGTSEADLYFHHPEKKKLFPVPLYAGLSAAAVFMGILLKAPLLSLLPVFFVLLDFLKKYQTIAGIGMPISLGKIILSSLRGFLAFYYYVSFHLIRYYLIFMLLLGFALPLLWMVCLGSLLLSSTVDYWQKRPQLSYPSFLGVYLLEHTVYQCGVIFGCIKQEYFKCYFPQICIK